MSKRQIKDAPEAGLLSSVGGSILAGSISVDTKHPIAILVTCILIVLAVMFGARVLRTLKNCKILRLIRKRHRKEKVKEPIKKGKKAARQRAKARRKERKR